MRRSHLLSAIPCLAVAFVLTMSRGAQAGPFIGLDLDLGAAFQERTDFSYGLGGRLGYKLFFENTNVFLQPELGGHFMSFGAGRPLREFDQAGAAFGGVRFGFGGSVRPNVFAHVGLGFVGSSEVGPYADIGVGVDFQLTRVFSLGPQIAYNSVTVASNGDAAKWLSVGLDFGFDFTGRVRVSRGPY